MSAYATVQDLLTKMSLEQLLEAIDDDASGLGVTVDGSGNVTAIDTSANGARLTNIIAIASAEIDGYLSTIFPTPFKPVPPKVNTATIYIACESLALRRLPPDIKNPFSEQANAWRDIMVKISSGELNLDQNFPRSFYQGNAILERSLTCGSTG